MRTMVKVLIVSLGTAAMVAPAAAAGMGGGGGAGGAGGAMGNGGGGGGMILPQGGGGAPAGGGFAAHSAPGPRANFAQQGNTGGLTGSRTAGSNVWRHHRPWRGGPIVTGGYAYDGGDYDYDETDVNHCMVYRKAYNSRHQFVGWTRVDDCAG
jgi:hypothetical protein